MRVNEKYTKTKKETKDVAYKNKFSVLTVETAVENDEIDNPQVISPNSSHTNCIAVDRTQNDVIRLNNPTNSTWRQIKYQKAQLVILVTLL